VSFSEKDGRKWEGLFVIP